MTLGAGTSGGISPGAGPGGGPSAGLSVGGSAGVAEVGVDVAAGAVVVLGVGATVVVGGIGIRGSLYTGGGGATEVVVVGSTVVVGGDDGSGVAISLCWDARLPTNGRQSSPGFGATRQATCRLPAAQLARAMGVNSSTRPDPTSPSGAR
jgi:hypothetical protein